MNAVTLRTAPGHDFSHHGAHAGITYRFNVYPDSKQLAFPISLHRMQRETKLFAWFAITLGAVGILMGLAAFLGWPVRASGSSCKAICGLSLLFTEVLGDRAGMWVGGLLWLAAGLAFFGFGWRLLKERAA